MFESQGRSAPPEILQELSLDVSTEELLNAERAFTYADLHAVLGNEDTVAWLTPHAVVAHAGIRHRMLYGFRFNADGKVIVAFANSGEHLLEICDVLLRLVAASTVYSVALNKLRPSDSESINAPTLSYLIEQCPSLKALTLEHLEIDKNHCRVLGSYSRPDLEIELKCCTITGSGAITLAEVLGRNQGPTVLDNCAIDYSILADGLRGNSRLKRLRTTYSINLDDGNRQGLAIANALRENKGLVKLSPFLGSNASDETWGAICHSLKTHPTLEVLNLRSTQNAATATAITSRIPALVDMMKVNASIHTIHLDFRYNRHQLFRESVIPYLETNLFRPRLLAIQKTRPIVYRAKVLGRALLSVRTHPNRFWMLLSGNAEVSFPSRTTTIAAAANIPTPATATSTVNAAAVAASVMSGLTTTTTASLPAATAAAATHAAIPSTASASDGFASTPTVTDATAANVATRSAGQKRKASP
jgi:hypothetical protein